MNTQTRPVELKQSVLIVTGLSGAGKTSVMEALEDLDFYCVDNLPLPLLTTFLQLTQKKPISFHNIALGIDARGEEFLQDFTHEIAKLKTITSNNVKVLFLNANEQTLLQRFQETRRKHPLAHGIDVGKAIQKEKKILEPIAETADIILDTDDFNIQELRRWIRQSFSGEKQRHVYANLISFGFKYGVPQEINLLYDLRFLPNPHHILSLKNFTGKQPEITNYLFKQPAVIDYWDRLRDFLSYHLKKYHEEGRFFVTIGIGCTGGKHRSVAFVEQLAKEQWNNVTFLTEHRDIGKE